MNEMYQLSQCTTDAECLLACSAVQWNGQSNWFVDMQANRPGNEQADSSNDPATEGSSSRAEQVCSGQSMDHWEIGLFVCLPCNANGIQFISEC